MRHWIGVPAAFLCLVLFSPPTHGEAAVRLEVGLAWNGVIRPQAYSELAVSLLTQEARDLTLEVSIGGATTIASARPAAGTPLLLAIPYRASALEPVELRVLSENGAVLHRVTRLGRPVQGHGLVGVAVSNRNLSWVDDWQLPQRRVFHVPPWSVPRTVQAYDTIAALVLDAETLSRLDDEQLAALQSYLASCGKLLAIDLTEQMVSRLKAVSGCAQRFLAAVPREMPDQDAVARWIGKPSTALPTARELRDIAPVSGDTAMATAVLVFLIGYLGFAVTAGHFTRRPALMLSTPLVATALAVIVWHNQPARESVVIWAEVEGRDTAARYTALLRVQGRGIGNHRQSIPINSKLTSISDGMVVRHSFDRRGSSSTTLDLPTHLYSIDEVSWEAAFQFRPFVSVSLSNGRPLIVNRGDQTLIGGTLAWRDRLYPVSGLAPGEAWSIADQPVEKEPTAVGRLLASRIGNNRTAFLMPWVQKDLALAGQEHLIQSWFLFIAGPETQDVQP